MSLSLRSLHHAVRLLACVAGAALLSSAHAQQQAPSAAPPPVQQPTVQSQPAPGGAISAAPRSASTGAQSNVQPGLPAGARPALRVASSPAARSSGKVTNNITKPLWSELTPAQRESLAPLATPWNTLNEAQKRKWIALSANFPKMPPAEQAKLHSRMTEWAALSAQQRVQARLNFGQTQKLSADDKRAKWEAYQALPAEEKKKLAAVAAKPPTTAAAVKPVAPEKLANVPKVRPKPDTRPPRIAAAPNQVDRNTLLPQHPAASAPVAN